MTKVKDIVSILETLVGSKKKNNNSHGLENQIFNGRGLGYSQFNEILLLCGFNKCSFEFFQFLVDGTYDYSHGAVITDLDQLTSGVNRFIEKALLHFGNVKYAYKLLSNDTDELYYLVGDELKTEVKEFTDRHEPVQKIEEIPANKTYYLGYIIEAELNQRLKENPNDEEAKSLNKERKKYVEIAKRNQIAYLSSAHLDVYVATSMRKKHEFLFVNRTISEVFGNSELQTLNLRYFDPTQAYCDNRIDKGLSEALMLKNALCTLYLAQEAETLGKDSELASTLAQGKVVVAYIPIADKKYMDDLLTRLTKLSPERTEKDIIIEQLMIFNSTLAWKNEKVRTWLDDESKANVQEMKELLYDTAYKFYNKKADTLKEHHPLGIQVNLDTGVANGVLVVRTTEDCSKLIYNIATSQLEFDIEDSPNGQDGYIYLREKISTSIFRLKTGDVFLTNSFWNFYTKNQ